MENKKNPNADLQKYRGPLILMGLAISASAILMSFEMISVDRQEISQKKEKEEEEILDIPEFQQPDEPPPPPKETPPPPQVEEIVEVEDEEEIEEVDLDFNLGDEEVADFDYSDTEEEETVEVQIYDVVQKPPSFPGGDKARIKYLSENISYPPMAKESNIQGKVYVQFVVYSDGSIRDVKVLRGIGGGCDKEAVRVIKKMPRWNPGEQMGQKVNVKFVMPIVFKLQ